jgi:glycosyltransferase involved in cell wall biosynthesis
MSKRKVLVFIDWYLPGYKAGGPIQSVANIVSHLKNDFDFKVITANTDLHETLPYNSIKSDAWNVVNGTEVYYFSAANQSYRQLKMLMQQEQFDVIYINSLFSKFFALFPLLIANRNFKTTKVIVAPRGMLGEGALQLKATKKKFFLALAKITGMFKKVTWHASTPLEAIEIRNVFGTDANVQVALNLSKARAIIPVNRIKRANELRLVFLSRIAAKKNLLAVQRYLLAIETYQQITFDYFGPVDDATYAEQCSSAFKTLPANIQVNYRGVVAPENITTVLSSYHLSILPTLNENFGHSIVESWVAGCPVLISDQTPWKNLEENKTGFVAELNNDNAFVDVIKKMCAMEQSEFDLWSSASYDFAKKIIENPEAIAQNKKLFLV